MTAALSLEKNSEWLLSTIFHIPSFQELVLILCPAISILAHALYAPQLCHS